MTDIASGGEALLGLLGEHDGGVLVTLERDGGPQLSNVNHAHYPHEGVIRVSVTDDRAKTRNLRRDPRAACHVTGDDRAVWTAVGATAGLTPPAAGPYDAVVEQLTTPYRDVRGEHPDRDDYRRVTVEDRRVVLTPHIEHAYGRSPA